MEIRHLRCFMALAEELHFARAAAKLHIEQSPLSRTIKELEEVDRPAFRRHPDAIIHGSDRGVYGQQHAVHG